MAKFKEGETITAIEKGRGFDEVTITGFVEDRGRKCYKGIIPCGIVTIPINSEVCYKLKE